MSSRFTRIDDLDLKSTVVAELADTVNDLRDLKTQLGLRAYEVRIVVIGWTGGTRGRGEEYVKRTTVILPTPKVTDITTLDEIVQSAGTDEFGSVRVSEINPEFTEDQLRGLGPKGEPIARDENVFWEVEFPMSSNRPGVKRRFTMAAAPSYLPARLMWTVVLERARGDRDRSGRIKP